MTMSSNPFSDIALVATTAAGDADLPISPVGHLLATKPKPPSLLHLERFWLATLQQSWRSFERALAQPAAHQQMLLRRILAKNAASQYGQAHGFNRIRDLASYQARVPLVDYEALAPWVDQIAEGTRGVLTCERTLALTQSAGMTGTPKLLPVTRGLLNEIDAAVRPYLYDLCRAKPELLRQRVYLQMPPPFSVPARRPGGVAYASADPTRLLGVWARAAMDSMLAVPPVVSRFADRGDWWRLTRQHLLASADLGLMIVSNPSFLTELMQSFEEDLADLLALLPTPRADAIRAGLDAHGRITAAAFWPELRLVCAWQDGPAAALLPALRRYFPGVPMHQRPLTCKEGILTVPLLHPPGHATTQDGAPLAVGSHVVEFLDADAPRAPLVLADGVQTGRTYLPVLTTSGGLYRYQLKEAVRCVGHYAKTPLLQYVDKAEPAGDLRGELLTAHRVQDALEEVTGRLGFVHRFALATPTQTPVPGYCLYIDTDASHVLLNDAAARLDAALCRHHAYWQCRNAEGLAPLRVVRIRHGWETFQRVLRELGVAHSSVKATVLDCRPIWDTAFSRA